MKKRVLSGVLAVLLLLLSLSLIACKKDEDDVGTQGLAFEKIEGKDEYRVTGIGDAEVTEIVIPNKYKYRAVTEIGEEAFRDCTSLAKITIPKNITAIGKGAFAGCTALTEVQLEAWAISALGAEDAVFENAGTAGEGITLTVGLEVTRIPAYLFASNEAAPKLTEVVFHEDAKCLSVDRNAFAGCTVLTAVDFSENSRIESIGANAFTGCTSLTEISIPASVRVIGAAAFSMCSKLAKVNFAEDARLIKIETYAFSSTRLTDFIVPASVTEIGASVFFNCPGLITVEFKSIRDWRVYELTDDPQGTEIDVSSRGDNARRFTEPDKAYWGRILRRQEEAAQ